MDFITCIDNIYLKTDIADKAFFEYLLKNKIEDFHAEECISSKKLLSAYIKRSYELYEKDKKIQQLLEKLEKIDKAL